MTRVGDIIRDRSGKAWKVVGQDGRFVIAPEDGMSGPEPASAGRLRLEFSVDDATDPAPVADDGGERGALAEFGARVIAAGRASSDGWGDLAEAHAEADAARRAASHFDSGD